MGPDKDPGPVLIHMLQGGKDMIRMLTTIRGKIWLIVGLMVAAFSTLFLYQNTALNDVGDDIRTLALIDAKTQRILKYVGYYSISQDEATLKEYEKYRDQVRDLLKSAEISLPASNLSGLSDISSAFLGLVDIVEGKDGFFQGIKKIRDMEVFDAPPIEIEKAIRGNKERLVKMNEFGKDMDKKITALADEQKRRADSQFVYLLVSFAIVAVSVAAFAAIVVRQISSRLGALSSSLETFAQGGGDLTKTIPDSGDDEISTCARYFNGFLGHMRQSVKRLSNHSDTVDSASADMRVAIEQIGNSADAQSATVHDTAAAVEESAVAIAHIAESADHAKNVAASIRAPIEKGARDLGKGAENMARIAQSSEATLESMQQLLKRVEEVSGIGSMIKEIADQTNLLALNAAIEAARAGDAGRGFAVVADEVRKLAERSAQHTAEITRTVSSMQESMTAVIRTAQENHSHSESGKVVFDGLHVSLNDIMRSNTEIIGNVEDISSAVREQRATSDHIARAMENVAQSVDESSQALHAFRQRVVDVHSVSASLKAEAGHFRI